MRKGEKLIKGVADLLSERFDTNVFFAENIYDYIQNEMSDEEFDKIMSSSE